VFGYFTKTQTWNDVKHVSWVAEFFDVLSKHEPTFRFVQSINLSEQTVHRFINTQQQPQKRFASQSRMQSDKHVHLPYSTLDWQTPFGICRFLEEIRTGSKLPNVFVKYAPLHDTTRQRVSEVVLGRRQFEELIVGRKWTDASNVLFTRMSSREHFEHVRKLVLEVTTWTYPSSVDELERQLFSDRKRTTLELLNEIRDISNELKTFLKNGTLDVLKVESRLLRMDKIVQLGTSTNLVEVSPDEFQNVFHVQTLEPSLNNHLQEEHDRLVRLLEEHKIDYIQVPSNNLEQLQTFIQEQITRQQQLARTLFDESVSNAEKFAAENELDKIQKKVETAKRKQFTFETFMNERWQVVEELRPFVEQVRTKLVERYKDVSSETPFVKMPFKTRRLFPDSEIGAFVSQSSTHMKCWLSVVRNESHTNYLKFADVRKSLCTLFESCKWVPALLFLCHFGRTCCLDMDDLKLGVFTFLLQLDTNVHEHKSGLT
jgi:hypothetical protein